MFSPAHKKGFTLIELLVVISIIGLLASIVLTSLNSARNKAKVSKALETMEMINKAAYICYEGSAAFIPTPANGVGGTAICAGGPIVPDITAIQALSTVATAVASGARPIRPDTCLRRIQIASQEEERSSTAAIISELFHQHGLV